VQITVNGEAQQVASGLSLAALLRELDLNERRIAVEVNRNIVAPEQYRTHSLGEGDEIEIVHFVGGG
jgi:thiamine biosynthesis protein ThiS